MLSLNVTVGFIVAFSLRFGSPRDYDSRLKPRGRVSPTGFPCIEAQLATVMWSMVLIYNQQNGASASTILALIGSCVVSSLLLALLRLYAGTHTLLQLLASVAFGAASIPALFALAGSVFPQGMDPKVQSLNFMMLVLAWAGYVCYQAENHSMPFLRVEREECAFKI